jgi:hypothetical protein
MAGITTQISSPGFYGNAYGMHMVINTFSVYNFLCKAPKHKQTAEDKVHNV